MAMRRYVIRTKVPVFESNMTMTEDDMAKCMNTTKKSVRAYSNREKDPLPLKAITGKYSRGFAFTDDFEAWLRRNTVPYYERKAYAHNPPRRGGKLK